MFKIAWLCILAWLAVYGPQNVFQVLLPRALADNGSAADVISLCGNSSFYNSTTVPYAFNNNAWGNDGTGYSCLNVSDGGTSFSVSYKWTGTETLVKGYPYMKYDPSNLPVPLANISGLNFAGEWSTTTVDTEGGTNEEIAVALHLSAWRGNVAVDMFLSPDAENSTELSPPIEVMIWPFWSPYVYPLGWHESPHPSLHQMNIAGDNFELYHGYNDGGQHVFSWLASQNMTKAHADYAPLIAYLWQNDLLPENLWLGQLEFGTEVLHAATDTVFKASNYTLQLLREGDPNAKDSFGNGTSTSTTMLATATPTKSTQAVSATATSKGAAVAFVRQAEPGMVGAAAAGLLGLAAFL